MQVEKLGPSPNNRGSFEQSAVWGGTLIKDLSAATCHQIQPKDLVLDITSSLNFSQLVRWRPQYHRRHNDF